MTIGSFFIGTLIFFQSIQQADSLEELLAVSKGEQKVFILNELCRQYLNSNPVEAAEYSQKALEIALAIGDSSGISAAYNNIGLIFKNKGDLDKALISYMKGADIQERNNLLSKLANTYGNIGTVYSIQGEHQIALDYFRKAEITFREQLEPERLVGALNNIGNVFMDMGQPDSALNYYQRALKIYENLEDNSSTFVPFENIGNIYFLRGDMEAAMAYYQSAYDLDVFRKNINGQASALHNIAVVFGNLENYEKAISTLYNALELAQTTGNQRLLVTIYESLGETYFKSGDTFMAYSFQKLHDAARDSLFDEESAKRISDIESAYEMEKMESELEALQLASDLQQLQIENDKIIITAIILISVVGLSLTAVILKELQLIKRNKKKLEVQKQIIEEKNRNITYSINYAKSIQESLLDYSVSAAKRSKFFVLFEPKDIVSGDFYWYKEKGDIDILAVADCTGHGVAGAFMTVVGHAALEQIINKDGIEEPAEVLERLNVYVQESLKNNVGEIMDHSMDIALCKIDRKNKTLTFSGLNRPLLYFENGQLVEVKGTKVIQGEQLLTKSDFDTYDVKYSQDSIFYMFSDGFPDQFGGPKNKKYMYGRFKKLLASIHEFDLEIQRNKLEKEIAEWKGSEEQTDDIAVLGFRP